MSASRFLPLALAAFVATAAFAQTPAPVPAAPAPAPAEAAPTPDAPVPAQAKAWILMDHTSDPDAASYRLDPARTDLAREFRASIRGPWSKELQQLIHRMRWGAWQGRWLIYVVEPGRRWALAPATSQ